MNIRAMLIITALMPLPVFADRGDFSFNVDDSVIPIPSTCVESLTYVPKDEIDTENILFSLTPKCAKLLKAFTRNNIGKTATITYKGNALSQALIASTLGSSFRISSKEMPKVLLMQILNDYGAATE